MLLADVLPSQRENFVSSSTCKCEQANRSDYPRRAAFVLLSLTQGITQAAKLGLAQEAFTPSLWVFLHVAAGV